MIAAGLGAGCAGPETVDAETSRPRPAVLPVDPSLGRESVSNRVVRGFDMARDPEGLASVFAAARGQESDFFLEALRRSANETRDVGIVLHGAARDLVLAEGRAGAEVVVRELWGRECCLRRSFLAEGLAGMSLGLEMRGDAVGFEPESVRRLEELSLHADPGVAAAAREALSGIRGEVPRP